MNTLLSETQKKNELWGREMGEGENVGEKKKSLSLFLFGSVARQQMGSQHPVVLAGTDQPTCAASLALVHSQAGSGPCSPPGIGER